MENTKILLIGAGIAGITLARQLEQRNISFMVLDSGNNFSSRVAAGLINPMVFRRMAKSWRVDEFLPFAKNFYEEATRAWGNTYFNPIPIRRAFAHQQEYDFWVKKQEMEEFQSYLSPLSEEDHQNTDVINTFGTGKVLQAAYIETNNLLEDAYVWLTKTNRLHIEKLLYADIDPVKCTFKNETFTNIIFCEGYNALENPWFNYLPLQATKGEIITISSDAISQSESLNRKCFILPTGDNKYKVGATYSWDNPTLHTTPEAREELVVQLQQLTCEKFDVIDQYAGIRPTVLDRRPLLGSHPIYTSLAIFNGLGTKGYLMAPLLAKEMADFLLDAKPLDREVDIERYHKRFQ